MARQPRPKKQTLTGWSMGTGDSFSSVTDVKAEEVALDLLMISDHIILLPKDYAGFFAIATLSVVLCH